MDSVKTRALLFTSLAHFVNDGSVFFVPVIADLLAASKGFTPLEVALVLFTYGGLSTLSSLYVGRLAESNGKIGNLVAVGIVLLGFGLLGFGLVIVGTEGDTLLSLSIALSALIGVGSAFYHPISAEILRSSFGSATGGRALGMNGAIGSLGRALYPSLFFVAALVLSQSGAMTFLGILSLTAAVMIWFGLRKFRSEPRGRTSRTGPGALRPVIVALSILAFLRTTSMFGVAGFVPELFTFQKGLGVGTSLGFLLSAMFGAAILGQPLFGYLMDKFDGRLIFLLSSSGAALSIVGLTLTEGVLSILFLALFGLFVYTAYPIVLSLSASYVPKGSEVMANAIVWGVGTGGGNAVGGLVVGALVMGDYGRLDFAFQILAVVAFVSALFVLLFPRQAKPAEKTEEFMTSPAGQPA